MGMIDWMTNQNLRADSQLGLNEEITAKLAQQLTTLMTKQCNNKSALNTLSVQGHLKKPIHILQLTLQPGLLSDWLKISVGNLICITGSI